MVTDSRSSDVVDPLEGYWGISLFPKTFGVLPEPSSKPFDPDDDLQAIHNHLKSMALQSPIKLKERAKIILNSGNMSCQASKDKYETVPTKAEDDPRERRPALGHKRARFSLRPDCREPAVSLEPTLDVKKWKNPEEFFMAYERLENAKREIQKQMGGNQSDSDQHNLSPVVSRRRRPGIVRRSAKYKHLYSEDNDNVVSSQETFESSILSPSYQSSQRENDKNCTSQEMESAGKTGRMDDEMLEDLLSHNNEVLEGDQVMKLLQDHLHLQIKPLDIDKLSLPDIQDISKIGLKSSSENLPKSKHVLPPIDNILKAINTKTPLELRNRTENTSASPTLLKNPFASVALLNRRISLTSPASDPFSPHDIDQLPGTGNCLASPTPPKSPFASPALLNRRISPKSPASDPYSPHDIDQLPGRENCIASSTLLKSPFASLALLNTRISLTSPAREPFSPRDIDQLPVTNPSPIEHIGKQFGPVDAGKQSNKMKPPLNEQDNNTRSHEVAIRDFSQASENCVTEDSTKLGALPAASSPSHVAAENQVTGSNIEGIAMHENLGGSYADEDEDTLANRVTVEEKVEDVPREAVASAQHNLDMMDSMLDNSNNIRSQLASPENHTMDGQSGNPDNDAELHKEINKEKSRITADKQSKVKSRRFRGHRDKETSRRKSLAGTASPENRTVDGQSRTPDNDGKLHNEIIQEQSRITVNKQSKVKSRPSRVRKDKEISRRKSLAGAGTIWKSGVRRSTRIRTRPLEYWKGERLLYGRIHESLATVIGLKYASPAKVDERPTLKVKSFVSDEYKELVELAALH